MKRKNGPIIRKRSSHTLSRKDIDPDALKVLYRLSRSGYTAYLVGGAVRDLLLKQKPKDFDVSTNAHPSEIKRLFRNCFLIGRRFRLAHIRFGQKIIETSTFRSQPTENKVVDSDKHGALVQHRDNTFGTPEEDALRRDFTVNGLFYDISTFSIIDHVGGLADLEKKIIKFLDSKASNDAKNELCRDISQWGSKASLPVLDKLMENEDTKEMARFAKERISGEFSN
jgi:poly(A) polymerase